MYIKVKVATGTKRESVIEKSEGIFEISVKEKAQRNEANARVIELIAKHLNAPKNKVKIANGHHRKNKLIIVDL